MHANGKKKLLRGVNLRNSGSRLLLVKAADEYSAGCKLAEKNRVTRREGKKTQKEICLRAARILTSFKSED